jgi:hypothetical protein
MLAGCVFYTQVLRLPHIKKFCFRKIASSYLASSLNHSLGYLKSLPAAVV